MTTASPTPFAASSFGNGRVSRQRQPIRAPPIRPALRRHSPLSLAHGDGFSADAPMLQRFSLGDSSDEDVPKPMNFSALTKALLDDRPSARAQSPPRGDRDHEAPPRKEYISHQRNKYGGSDVQSRAGTPQSRGALRISRRSPPPATASQDDLSPRIVHLSGSKPSSGLRRTASTLEGERKSASSLSREYVTPASQNPGRLSDRSRSGSSTSAGGHYNQSGSAGHLSGDSAQYRSHHASSGSHASSIDQAASAEQENDGRSKSRAGTDGPGSMRVKRVPVGSGTFLRGAPVRRGIMRHNSEEGPSPVDGHLSTMFNREDQGSPEPKHYESHSANNEGAAHEPVDVQDFATSQDANQQDDHRSWQPVTKPPAHDHHRPESRNARVLPSSDFARPEKREPLGSKAAQQPVFRVPDPLPGTALPDQENEPPPTFKRNKPQPSGPLVVRTKLASDQSEKPKQILGDAQVARSPKRTALQPLSQNTPLRPAPPPPKMTVLETATATAGASTVKSKKKRSHVIINGKLFTIRGRIGKGGSSDVYRVMAENDKMFALKKVNLEDCNEETVRGYKGEIDLLKKLENVDRVVRLFDWELNEQKQSLSVLMEIGESDLNKILASRLHAESEKLDLSFTRHYWREMLCCVAAVHAHDIVHSDLKPANFLLVSGRLKLIDFGIANAIDIDNTVNVHRETNVGTPNYMSPESLQDTNAGTDSRAPGGGSSGGGSKLMKLGKPSDVWSLGCILYQMTYGKPPFAHIANQWNRVCAIINPAVHITFPTTGIGQAWVPSSLRRLLQRCLDRDASKRPTLAQLLDDREAFLNPDIENEGAVPMTEGLLGQILSKVVQRCKDPNRGFPGEAELMRTYPKGYLDNIRAGLERG